MEPALIALWKVEDEKAKEALSAKPPIQTRFGRPPQRGNPPSELGNRALLRDVRRLHQYYIEKSVGETADQTDVKQMNDKPKGAGTADASPLNEVTKVQPDDAPPETLVVLANVPKNNTRVFHVLIKTGQRVNKLN